MIILKYRGSAYIQGVQPEISVSRGSASHDRTCIGGSAEKQVNQQICQRAGQHLNQQLDQQIDQLINQQYKWIKPLKYRGVNYFA